MGQASARRVVARFLGATEHDSPEALKKYLHEHPDADKSKHTVKKDKSESKDEDEEFGEYPDFGGAAKQILDAVKGLKDK